MRKAIARAYAVECRRWCSSQAFPLGDGAKGVIDSCAPMAIHEIILPETKPETEWVRGRPLQKVSPQRTHALLQRQLGTQLDRWAAPVERRRD